MRLDLLIAAGARGPRELGDEACAAGGRDPVTLGRLVLTGLTLDSGVDSPDQFADTLGRYEAVGVTDFVVHWPRPSPPYRGDESAFERLFESRL